MSGTSPTPPRGEPDAPAVSVPLTLSSPIIPLGKGGPASYVGSAAGTQPRPPFPGQGASRDLSREGAAQRLLFPMWNEPDINWPERKLLSLQFLATCSPSVFPPRVRQRPPSRQPRPPHLAHSSASAPFQVLAQASPRVCVRVPVGDCMVARPAPSAPERAAAGEGDPGLFY